MFVSPERKEKFAFSLPYYGLDSYVLIPNRLTDVYELKDLAGKKVGYAEGSFIGHYLQKNYPQIEPVSYPSHRASILAAARGEVDGILSDPVTTRLFLNELGLNGEFHFSSKAESSQLFHAAVRLDNKKLLKLIDQGFDAMNNAELAEIEDRWIQDPAQKFYSHFSQKLRISEEDKKWLQEHGSINVRVPENDPPLCFRSDFRKDEIRGMIPDALALLSSFSGIPLRMVSAASGQSYDMEVVVQAEEQKAKTGDLKTHPLLLLPYVVVNRVGSKFLADLDPIKLEIVAVKRGSVAERYLRRNYPDMALLLAETHGQALRAVSENVAEDYLGPLPTSVYEVQKNKLINLRVAASLKEPELSVCLVADKSHRRLVSLLNRFIQSVPHSRWDRIVTKWASMQESTIDWDKWFFNAALVGSGMLLFLVLLFYWNRKLAHEVAIRQRAETALTKAQELLEQRVQDRTEALRVSNEQLEWEISERKETEERLSDSEQKFRAIFEQAADAILLIDPEDGGIIEGNRQAYGLFGFTETEFKDLNIFALEGALTPEEYENAWIRYWPNLIVPLIPE